MKAGDLRIGNYVDFDAYRGRLSYTWFSGNRITSITEAGVDIDKMWVPYKWVKPILLNKQWFERLGFEMNEFKQYEISINPVNVGIKKLCFAGDYLYIKEGTKLNDLNTITLWNKESMNKFYVHQLQNLYFALTGNELEFKLSNSNQA